MKMNEGSDGNRGTLGAPGSVAVGVEKGVLKDLHVAIELGDTAGVEKALAGGADPNARFVIVSSERLQPALVRAARVKNSAPIAKLLLDAGGEISVRTSDAYSTTLLGLAAGNGEVELCRLLVERGASVNELAQEDWTALHVAANNGHAAVCTFLAANGADIYALTNQSHTALHLAARNNAVGCCRVLLGLGMSTSYAPDTCDDYYLTPFQVAVRYGMVSAAVFLAESGAEDLGQLTRSGVWVLDLAVDDRTRANLRTSLLSEKVTREVGAGLGSAAPHAEAPARASNLSPI
jgi:hypothetical protein